MHVRRTLQAATAALLLLAGAAGAGDLMHHSMRISVFPPDNSLLAADTVYVPVSHFEDGTITFLLNRSLEIDDIQSPHQVRWYSQEDIDPASLKPDPDEEDIEFIGRGKGVFIEIADMPPAGAPVPIAISYSGVLYDSLQAPDRTYSRGFATTTGLIDERGTYLSNSSLWYPFHFDHSFTFRLTVDLPPDYMSVSQGALEREYLDTIRDERRIVEVWRERNPTPEFYLVAGRYFRHQETHNGTRIMTYTYETSDSLSQVYLDATRRYISMYEELIGEYPHPKFALVENFWQTGYGMPSFTLLGSRVIRLPFIVHTSYGHEILHNWWGNCVFVDYDTGNWCEGLTTYGADYLYKESRSPVAARDYRHQTLITFNNYVTGEADFPLSKFHERHDTASQSVGYGKSLFVFHMLRQYLGDETYWQALRYFYRENRHRTASWKDLEEAFSHVSGENLEWYFDQWVHSTGLPELRLEAAWTEKAPGGDAIKLTLNQVLPAFVVDVPVVIETADGDIRETVRLSEAGQTFTFKSDSAPLSLAVDPDFDVFRRLYDEEIPITIGGAFANESGTVIIGDGEQPGLRMSLAGMAHALGVDGDTVDEAQAGEVSLEGSHLWFMGRGGALGFLLAEAGIELAEGSVTVAGEEHDIAGRTFICTIENPREDGSIVAVIIPADTEPLPAILRKLPHYGRNSYVIFEGERAVKQGVWESGQSPLRVEFAAR